MKLIELSANHSSFKTIRFNPNGLTLIVGDGSKDKTKGSSNGVGKTLALGLVHHCLGANAQHDLKEKLEDWVFSLTFRLGDKEYKVDRSADGKNIILNGEKITTTAYRNWLNASGIFTLNNEQNLSFRSLFTRFARYTRKDCDDPIKTDSEQDVEAQLRTFFLLGLDCSLIPSKKEDKNRLADLKKTIKTWKKDPVLQDIFRAGHEPELRMERLEKEIPRLEVELAQFDIAENYHAIVLESQEKTNRLRNIDREISVQKFQLDGIEKLLKQQPDISRLDLLALYEGLEATFKPEVLAHFDAVEKFHNSFVENRKKRLEADKVKIEGDIQHMENERKTLGKLRDDLMKDLHGKRALDEFTAISNHVSDLKLECNRLQEYLSFESKRKEEKQTLKEKMLREEREADEYISNKPNEKNHLFFQSIANQLYPQSESGIVLGNNTGDNQLRYKFSVQIDGDRSDGINNARILCFDWLLLMRGMNHNMDFLWHDNRLFADLGEQPRAKWFSFILKELKNSKKQYIATINQENYDSMKNYLDNNEIQELDESIKLVLRDDKKDNKLLGIQI
ncbi:MAG: DUF2326 domain-containing protein [Methylococcales bacterium]|nr:DUF2326 domain-containing protein [Methylococcales bacterium]